MPDAPIMPPRLGSGLFTDLYELTMARAYEAEGLNQTAVFEIFFRELPAVRNFVITAGLADVLDYLEHLHFTDDDLNYLQHECSFPHSFLDRLRTIRFSGDVYAIPEGTVVFPHQPVAQVVAPMIEAQLIETFILNQIHFQSVIATKAARTVLAAQGRSIVDFGSRRAHGTDAALKVARVSYLMGAIGTSNVLAGRLYSIPIVGTMAHSYIQAHDDELAAFTAFAGLYPDTTLLVDTYDTLDGVRNVLRLAERLGDRFNVAAIRLDSGDLGQLAIESRRMLDAAGLTRVRIFASSGLDEYEIQRLLAMQAPIDAFGVGTRLAVSRDAPDLDFAYKLVEYAGRPRTKYSTGKRIHPGQKQVYRTLRDGRLAGDIIAPHRQSVEGTPLLQQVMHQGKRTAAGRISLAHAREHAARELAQLPEEIASLNPAPRPYPVQIISNT